jgi:hypothetical protein
MLHARTPFTKSKSRVRTYAGRELPNLTQREAARRLSVTHWYLNRVLRGHVANRRISQCYDALIAEAEAKS